MASTYTKPIAATRDPELQHICSRLAHGGILPIEIRLLRQEQMQVVLVRRGIVFPGGASMKFDWPNESNGEEAGTRTFKD